MAAVVRLDTVRKWRGRFAELLARQLPAQTSAPLSRWSCPEQPWLGEPHLVLLEVGPGNTLLAVARHADGGQGGRATIRRWIWQAVELPEHHANRYLNYPSVG
ncbi:hypothetical protein ACFV1W_21175 [Kitasatospora sp. NPDC059648]|uniref:hypothetical protein n=1 Tax=Kitasatospora sp. NPDC059648 TaxID=3346894 RepID=UPI0036C6B5DA